MHLRIGVIGVGLATVGASFICGADVAAADTVVAPQVYVRTVDPNNETVPTSGWQPVAPSVTLSTLGPFDIGVALQSQPSAEANRQAAQVDIVSEPPGTLPSEWSQLAPYAPYCKTLAAPTGTIQSTASLMNFHGDGAYNLNVSMYTDAQHQAFPGSTCSGGPATPVTLNVDAVPTASIAGTPLAPRVTAKARGSNGLVFSLPQGNEGFGWRCALNPVVAADGSVAGPVITKGQATGSVVLGVTPIDETQSFTQPGRWACSVLAFGGDIIGHVFPTPWVTTPAVTVRGQYERDQARTLLKAPVHGVMRMVVPAVKEIAAATAGGKLTFTLLRAGCVHRSRLSLHPVLATAVRVNHAGVATLRFHSPKATGFYLGRFTFGGTPLVLAGRDADATMQLGLFSSTRPYVTFIDPREWAPCAA
jgi:hypothetical protein